jgi:phosphoribosylglycinamide formyltransferase-1
MRLGVLVSGSGTNLQALLDAQAQGELAPGKVALVISNRPGAKAIARAEAAGVNVTVIDHKAFSAREAFEDAMLARLDAAGVEAVVLAGFMRVLTARFVARYPLGIVNTHPSLLPAFPGVDAAAQAIAHGVKVSGVTVHFVDTGLDSGPIIAQVPVPVWPSDDGAALQKRIQAEEHKLLPRVVRSLAMGWLSCQGRTVLTRAE